MPKLSQTLPPMTIDIEFAKIGLEEFFSSSKSRIIRFFSPGEPTLAFEKMKEIWQIAKRMAGDKLIAELETNGHFGDDIAEWIESHIDRLWISCDGPPEIQDTQRPTHNNQASSSIVISNVRRFADNTRIQFGVRPTISASNLSRQIELVDYFNSLNVKYVAASPTYHSKYNSEIITPPLIKFAKYFVPAYYHALELDMFYQTLLIVNFDEEVDFYCQASIPTPRLTPDGYVSCCDWAAFGSPNLLHKSMENLIYGWYDSESRKIRYDQSKINRIRQRNVQYLSNHACSGCSALWHCAGGCIGKMMAETEDLYLPTAQWCAAVRYLVRKLPINKSLYPVIHP